MMSCHFDDCRIQKKMFLSVHTIRHSFASHTACNLCASQEGHHAGSPPRTMPSGPLHHSALTRRASQRAHMMAVCPPASLFLRTARLHTTCGYHAGPGPTGDDDAVPTSIALIVPDEKEVVAVQSTNQA